MTREELLQAVNNKVDTTKFKSLSQKTINEELDDVLDDLSDDETSNDRIITKLANRLKRMDGNVHKSVSDEMKKNREAEDERKRKEEEERQKREREEDKTITDSKYDELLAKIKAMEAANEARDKKAAKDATIESVKRGLKDKFNKADLEMNDYFLEIALSKLVIPDTEVDVANLVSEAESIYTSDYKRANGCSAIPKKHTEPSFDGHGKIDDDEFAQIAERRKKRFGDADKK